MQSLLIKGRCTPDNDDPLGVPRHTAYAAAPPGRALTGTRSPVAVELACHGAWHHSQLGRRTDPCNWRRLTLYKAKREFHTYADVTRDIIAPHRWSIDDATDWKTRSGKGRERILI